MTGAGAARIALSDLVLGAELGGGGQGKVRAVEKRMVNKSWPVVYKEYKPDVQGQLRVDALERMVAFLPGQPPAVGQWLAGHTAWPAVLVSDGPQVSGFLMRQIPDEFFLTMPTGGRKTAGFEFLLNSLTYVNRMVGHVTPRQVFGLLLSFADTLERLHRLGVVAGDLSPKNLLFSLSGPRPDCFLIDCDAMGLSGDWVLKPVQTPGWQLPDGEAPETPEGDRYKFALLAVRLFLHEQHGKDSAALRRMDGAVADLAERGLSRRPTDRPALAAWLDPLRRAFDSAPLTWPTAAQAGPRTATMPTVTMPTPGAPTAGPAPAGTATGSTRPAAARPTTARPTTAPRQPSAPAGARRTTVGGTAPQPPAAPYTSPGGSSSSGGTGSVMGWAVMIGIIVLAVWQVATRMDLGSGGSEAMDTREEQATALHTVLAQNAGRRSGVADAVQSTMNCRGLQENRRVFERAADARADLVGKVDALSLGRLADGLASDLRKAWQSSEDADRAYVRVVDTVSGNCSTPAVTGSRAWRDAASANNDATAAKKDVVAAWNPVAREYGLDTFAWSDL
ncbi:hypothetical protein [Streptomyces sp. Je 1-369]|uniref:hypothetical protein n=1 Tax=Streptomyces sp. Je 1-369 TaxID=2966192 RepID=UPI0022869994|nr:hypothetical protein [Streptomyces sp. Je 1-369]WAL98668.1 hypothetical protein NOO62_31815 [Streptomyces sp. Je 1-369]